MSRRKVIIDTDLQADDAMALVMALDAHAREEIQILGITLVLGVGNMDMNDMSVNILRVLETKPEVYGQVSQLKKIA